MNQQSTLVGLFKETYAGSIVEAWGFMAKLAKQIEFVAAPDQPGNLYHQPVDVQFEHGLSATAAGTVAGLSSTQFLPASAGAMADAQIAGAQIVGRSAVSYEAIARSANSKAAFKQATQHIVRRLSQAVLKDVEIQLLHGQRGLGTVTANPSSGASRVIQITDESWSSGIWAGMVGATLEGYRIDTLAKVTTGLTSTSNAITVTSVDTVAKTVTISCPNATDNTLNLSTGGGTYFFRETHGPTTEFAGLDVWTSVNAATGSFYNINATTYDLWRSNQYSSSTGTLSFPKLLEAVGLMASYNLYDDVTAVMATRAFEVLNSDIAALRQFDVSYSESRAKNGQKALQFFGQTGMIEVMSHPFQKDGLCHIYTPSEAMRVGATDISFITRQGSDDKLILESATSAGSEMRCYSNQALFLNQPRHSVRLAGITY